jgi:hypothetical protein
MTHQTTQCTSACPTPQGSGYGVVGHGRDRAGRGRAVALDCVPGGPGCPQCTTLGGLVVKEERFVQL